VALERCGEAIEGLASFQSESNLVVRQLEQFERIANEFNSPSSPTRSVADVKSQLQIHLSELDVSFERVESLQKMVRLMEDNIWLGENPVLNNTILDIISRYKKVRVKLRGNQEHIIQSSLLAEQFLGTIEGVATWIVDMTAKISVPFLMIRNNCWSK